MARSLIVGLGLLLIGCGDPLIRDEADLESAIPAALVPDAPDVVTGVDCPGPILDGPVGITCTAQLAGHEIPVSVEIDAEDRAQISTPAVLVDVAAMAELAAERLTDDVGIVTMVECPGPPVVVSVPGERLRCAAVDVSGGSREVVITIESDLGDWTVAIAS